VLADFWRNKVEYILNIGVDRSTVIIIIDDVSTLFYKGKGKGKGKGKSEHF